jgi:AcrR family transcriptional regulator
MPRTRTITDEQILSAAREVFTEQGMSATTAEVARRAGVSEGTIFNRFGSKSDLMMAAMGFEQGPTWIKTAEAVDLDAATFEENLAAIGEDMLDFFEVLLPRIWMMMSSGASPADHFMDANAPPIRGIKVLTGLIYQAQRKGQLRPCDPEIVARQFIGALHFWAFAEHAGLNGFMPMPRQTYLRGVIKNIMEGIRAV